MFRRPNLLNRLMQNGSESEISALENAPFGVLLYDDNQIIQYVNKYFTKLFTTKLQGKTLQQMDASIAEFVRDSKNSSPVQINWSNKKFLISVDKTSNTIYFQNIDTIGVSNANDDAFVFGVGTLDNYEDAVQDLSESEATAVRSRINTTLNDWAKENVIILRNVSPERFFIVMRNLDLAKFEEEKFAIIEEIKEAISDLSVPITVSIGVAYGINNMNNLASLAQSNLDLALGRGGDQVVVKGPDEETRFYGGSSSTKVEKRSRVRVRMLSQALSNLILQASDVYIVGHTNPDMDSFGSSLGMYRFAVSLGKKTNIVIDTETIHSDVETVIENIKLNDQAIFAKFDEEKENNPDLPAPEVELDALVTERQAFTSAKKNSLVILVDHSRPSISAGTQLIEKLSSRVVIIDHHRRSDEDFQDRPLLTYIEPYASSTSELVTELIEFKQNTRILLNKIEATAMLGGIMLDTKNFSVDAGSRTFDAASFLRSAGADSVLIKEFTKESQEDVLTRSHLIELGKIKDGNAIATGENELVYDSVLVAQAADELLQIVGVNASYVIFRVDEDNIGISARSNGQTNVQLVMERLGGGGHLNNAATRIESEDVSQVHELLNMAINDDTFELKSKSKTKKMIVKKGASKK